MWPFSFLLKIIITMTGVVFFMLNFCIFSIKLLSLVLMFPLNGQYPFQYEVFTHYKLRQDCFPLLSSNEFHVLLLQSIALDNIDKILTDNVKTNERSSNRMETAGGGVRWLTFRGRSSALILTLNTIETAGGGVSDSHSGVDPMSSSSYWTEWRHMLKHYTMCQ